jgi:hypothetical protein
MFMIIDTKILVEDIKSSMSGILGKDITAVSGFSRRQLDGIADQTVLIASGIASGEITEATRDFFLDQLVELAHNFVNTLVGLIVATIEKLWNAIVSILWKTISKATGIVLPVAKF